jgi:hypothetical protein
MGNAPVALFDQELMLRLQELSGVPVQADIACLVVSHGDE